MKAWLLGAFLVVTGCSQSTGGSTSSSSSSSASSSSSTSSSSSSSSSSTGGSASSSVSGTRSSSSIASSAATSRVLTGDPIVDCPFGSITFVDGGPPRVTLNGMDFDNNGNTETATFDDEGVFTTDHPEEKIHDVLPGVPAPADFDGDGDTDIAWVVDPGDGGMPVWSIAWSPSTDGGVTTVRFGFAGGIPVPGDFDGDGRAELAMALSRTGADGGVTLWMIGPSSGGETVRACASQPGSALLPMSADVDGDGRSDLVTYDQQAGLWSWSGDLGRTWNGHAMRSTPAARDDVPIPGLYGTGDGAFGLFSASEQHWKVSLFAGGDDVADAELDAPLFDGGVAMAGILPALGPGPDGGIVRANGFYLWTQNGYCASDKEMDGTFEQFQCIAGRRLLQPGTAMHIMRGINGY